MFEPGTSQTKHICPLLFKALRILGLTNYQIMFWSVGIDFLYPLQSRNHFAILSRILQKQ